MKDLVSSGVGYDRRAGEGRGDGYGSVRRDRYDRRVGSVGSVNRAVKIWRTLSADSFLTRFRWRFLTSFRTNLTFCKLNRQKI